MQLQLNITSDSPAELATLLAALAPHFAGVSTPVEAVISRDQPVASESTTKRTRAPKATVSADPIAAYNAIAEAAGAPVVETPKSEPVQEEANAVLLAMDAKPVVEAAAAPKELTRQDKTLFIIEQIKRLTLPKAREAFKIPNDAAAFSMWAEGEIERVYALAVAA